jgi:hypothetical protein
MTFPYSLCVISKSMIFKIIIEFLIDYYFLDKSSHMIMPSIFDRLLLNYNLVVILKITSILEDTRKTHISLLTLVFVETFLVFYAFRVGNLVLLDVD